jgi:demethylmenaquinone methyltransferase/2-methoxy-6-polyprenyl-1,4-benzoquinol methylase
MKIEVKIKGIAPLLMNKFSGNDALFTGLDISKDMEKQFLIKTKEHKNIKFINKRIDQPFELDHKFDKVFISFVIHGFPHEIREIVIKNAYNNLKPGGTFNILDFAEFDMNKMPFHHRFVFKKIECKYAFDFIERDWKTILKDYGFNDFKETYFFKKYVRLLKAVKI